MDWLDAIFGEMPSLPNRLESLPQKFGGKNTEGGDPIPAMTKDYRESRDRRTKNE